jgi:hypothetical protein
VTNDRGCDYRQATEISRGGKRIGLGPRQSPNFVSLIRWWKLFRLFGSLRSRTVVLFELFQRIIKTVALQNQDHEVPKAQLLMGADFGRLLMGTCNLVFVGPRASSLHLEAFDSKIAVTSKTSKSHSLPRIQIRHTERNHSVRLHKLTNLRLFNLAFWGKPSATDCELLALLEVLCYKRTGGIHTSKWGNWPENS